MRLIVISLLLINLAYLGYQFTKPAQVAISDHVDVSVSSGAAPIRLVSEFDSQVKTKDKKESKQGQICWAVGPYPVELDAKHLYARMLAMDIEARVEARPEVIKKEYWVYLTPLANRKQAMRKLKELQKRKIDSFVITEGELENGISLGLFAKQESVDALVERLAQKNIEASVRPLTRTRNQYWVMAPVKLDSPVTEKTRERLMEGQDQSWLQIHCDSGLPNA